LITDPDKMSAVWQVLRSLRPVWATEHDHVSIKTCTEARHGGSSLLSYLVGRLRTGGSKFEASLDRKFVRPCLHQEEAWRGGALVTPAMWGA
jgi:hypothetical protein